MKIKGRVIRLGKKCRRLKKYAALFAPASARKPLINRKDSQRLILEKYSSNNRGPTEKTYSRKSSRRLLFKHEGSRRLILEKYSSNNRRPTEKTHVSDSFIHDINSSESDDDDDDDYNNRNFSLLSSGKDNIENSHNLFNPRDSNNSVSTYVPQGKSERTLHASNETKNDFANLCATEDVEFESAFAPEKMRCLALVAHNHMKPAMKEFVLANKNVLKKFRLTGTNTTMTMLRDVFKDDPIKYGPTCQSGPLGGDAELCALMCIGDLGGLVFLQDPMDSHPHHADIACLNRQANVHGIIQANNLSSAYGMMGALRMALMTKSKGLLRSFFETEYSPCVMEYKKRQQSVLDKEDLLPNIGSYSLYDTSIMDKILGNQKGNMEENLNFVTNINIQTSNPENTRQIIPTKNALYKSFSVDRGIALLDGEGNSSAAKDIVQIQIENRAIYRWTSEIIMYSGSRVGSTEVFDRYFISKIPAEKMRCLALLAHERMEPAMETFIRNNKNTLKKFILIGNKATMKMLKNEFREDPTAKFGPVCDPGPLGGDTQLCALMCFKKLGGLIYFQDPMETHPHQADIDCLNRQCNVHDIYTATNPSSAFLMVSTLRLALEFGSCQLIKSFLGTRRSPSVIEYKHRQAKILSAPSASSDIMSTLTNQLTQCL